jgi:hypothetical protein
MIALGWVKNRDRFARFLGEGRSSAKHYRPDDDRGEFSSIRLVCFHSFEPTIFGGKAKPERDTGASAPMNQVIRH